MFRTTPLRRAFVGLTAAFAMTVSLSACGEETADPGTGSGAPVPSASADTSLADKVPADIKASGKLTIGTDATYAPNEYLDADGKTIIGFDVDLFNAVAQKLGLTAQWESSKFDAIIPGVTSGKYTVGVSSFTVNADRLKEATMVSYFSAGTQWAAKAGATINPDDACGKKVAVQVGTVQLEDVTARSKKCTDGGKPKITIDQYQSQADATNAVVSGKDEAMLADSPIGAYAVKQTSGQLALVGEIYDAAPYGYVLPKAQADFGAAIEGAIEALIADGTYKTILTKWGVEAGGITDPAVNPQVS